MAVFIEKFGWSYNDYMHGTNFVCIDMMLLDLPRTLTEEESKNRKKKVVKANNADELQKELFNLFG